MLAESRLVYLMIYVRDLAVSRAFYEQSLGYRVLEEDDASVKYDAGNIILCLNRAGDYGITLPTERDNTIDITILVQDLDETRAALEKRGVVFSPTLRYEIGASADFYDPDGHWFSLYEPSQQAMTWPSGDKIRAVWNGKSRSKAEQPVSHARRIPPDGYADDFRLDGKDLIYLFLFVRDPNEAFQFYHDALGLRNIEGGPCKRGSTMEADGVIKYDAGGVILTTHHLDPKITGRRQLNAAHMKGIAPVFHVTNVERVVRGLSDNGVQFSYGPARSQIGVIARFEDPCGHVFYLYEPSGEVLGWPSGARIEQILTAAY